MKNVAICLTVLLYSTLSYSAIEKKNLRDFKFDHFSQFGEDGIIEKIFELIGTTSKVCIEFGACDGFICSNTAQLWKYNNWKAILIEPDQRFKDLVINTKNYNCVPINRFVGKDKHNSLEAILKEYDIHDPIDLLSIDIDGDDYYILDSLTTLHPRVIICEHNPTIPPLLDVYQQYGSDLGCSAAALVRLAATKGYSLVAMTDTNVFFVDSSLIDKFSEFEVSLSKIAINDYVKNIISSYSGMPIIIGPKKGQRFPYGVNRQAYTGQLNTPCEVIKINSLTVD